MSEITGTAVAHEAYAFACMRCGHGWENAFDIEHHVDGTGHNFVVYKCEGVRVPSPLSSPSCTNCGGHVVRIMRSGQVSSIRALTAEQNYPSRVMDKSKGAEGTAGTDGTAGTGDTTAGQLPEGAMNSGKPVHHWHLADLLHAFQHHK
ncbi:hypothetical protein QR77_14355 [Streptomyces sp. 150FB]|uniref:hypothetical protein n=1 Tax=Streptomyces sp. 150FB TaxID=1576605 RepID=UPI0005893C2E|nr:hypothetical protein [Streptomyces sp. 150FB]KIF74837.1 hypothetical protein QR77_14355 [Streptomyces sp. 150FB]